MNGVVKKESTNIGSQYEKFWLSKEHHEVKILTLR